MVKRFKYSEKLKTEYIKNIAHEDKTYIGLKIVSFIAIIITFIAIFLCYEKSKYFLLFPLISGLLSMLFHHLAKQRINLLSGGKKNAEDSLSISDGETLFYRGSVKPKEGEEERYKIFTVKLCDVLDVKTDGMIVKIRGRGKLFYEIVMENGERKTEEPKEVRTLFFPYVFNDKEGFVRLMKKSIVKYHTY